MSGRWWVAALPLPFLVGASLVLLLDHTAGFGALLELRAQVGRASARVAGLELQQARLQREVQALRAGGFAVEAAARTALGMVRPGEIAVRLDDTSAAALPPPAAAVSAGARP
jgi:cell division protein FtsB